ncbi:ribonuclease T2 family protein [Sphingomonas sp. SRS2]|uniref:ribonuclease T2 family protein n=1 Tax=Sphingomonas sp. SRS2 TaxID=133190 RepID=UPI0006184EA0|nr:ribonuclease T [Sphingomonas sp. SRS2]KKC24769.1 ribonuclease T [Sphingomonas sp. SRS2]
MRLKLLMALAALLIGPACAKKDAPSCVVPANLPRPMLEGPTVDQPRRLLPIGGYTLAITWSPEYCASRMSSPKDHARCGGEAGRFGFTLHGLWPDGEGAQWPQYCAPTRLVPDKVVREHFCSTPSPQLIQHEWEKHGTCMAKAPADYFARSGELFAALKFPDMEKMSGRTITAQAFQEAFAAANAGMHADQMRLNVGKQGWMEEVWICLDKSFRPTACPAHQGGAAPESSVRIR